MENIDIKEVFRKKNPRVARIIPGFIYGYIKRIIHQDEMNNVLAQHGNREGLDFINKILEYFQVKIDVKHAERIPSEGKFIFSANHPLGGLDGLVFAHVIGQRFPNIKFIVNDLLMNVKNMDSIFIPVNKHGKQSVEYVRRIEKTYESDAQILNFPAGLCSRKQKGVICDTEWKKSFVTKAIRHKRNIIPVHIDGRNSNFFYNLANIRKFLGIKTNFEMFYLVDEMFKQKNRYITLTIGEPIHYTSLQQQMKPQAWAEEIKRYIYNLPGKKTEI